MTHFVNPKEVEGDLVAYLVDLTHSDSRPPARVPDRVPAGRAPGHRRRRRAQPRGGPLPQQALGPALHPQSRRHRRRRAAVGAGALQVGITRSYRRTASITPVASAIPSTPIAAAPTTNAVWAWA
jgi:hypothetical protein